MSAPLTVPYPLELLLDARQLRALADECQAWEEERYGPITTLLEVPRERGEPGRWRGSFLMLGGKAERALAAGPRRDGRYRVEVSANQAERVHAALTWRLATHSAVREPDAPARAWCELADGIREAAARPYGLKHECAPPVPTPSAPSDEPRATVVHDQRQADLFAEVTHG